MAKDDPPVEPDNADDSTGEVNDDKEQKILPPKKLEELALSDINEDNIALIVQMSEIDLKKLEAKAEVDRLTAETNMRTTLLEKLTPVFAVSNGVVLAIIVAVLVADWVILAKIEKATLSDRIIDHKVIMTLLGAATVQLGGIMLTMTKFLFNTKVKKG